MNDKLLTIQEAAKVLGVSTKTMRRWDASGRLSPQRTVGNQRRYSMPTLEEFLKQKKTASQNDLSQKLDKQSQISSQSGVREIRPEESNSVALDNLVETSPSTTTEIGTDK